jgi:hypothetical protein
VKAHVVGDIGGIVEGSPGQQAAHESGGDVIEDRQRGPGEVVFAFASDSLTGRDPMPYSGWGAADQGIDSTAGDRGRSRCV